MLHPMPLLSQVPLRSHALGRPSPRLGQCPPGTVGQVTKSANNLVETFTCVPSGAGGGGGKTHPSVGPMPMPGSGGGGGGILPGAGGGLPTFETYTPPAPGGSMPGALPGSGIPTGGGALPGAGFDSGAFQSLSPSLPLAPGGGAPSTPSSGLPPPPGSFMDPGYAYQARGETPTSPGGEGEAPASTEEEEAGTNPLLVGGLSLAALLALVALLD